ncbi:MAG: nitrous oxide reductase family maturation protein NosD, partial [Promethearchaeota archaeon]
MINKTSWTVSSIISMLKEILEMPRKRMSHSIVTSLIVLLILFSFVQAPNATVGDSFTHFIRVSIQEREETSQIVPHAPIAIDGDINFNATIQSEGWFGNGTQSNPYLIENLLIDLGGISGNCISISNTRAYFIIQNCGLTGASVNTYSGIYLDNVTNGLLADNNCWHNDYGIKIEDSSNSTLSNNTCYNNNWYGIWLLRSGYIGVFGNVCYGTAYGSGISVELSGTENEIFNNTCFGNNLAGIHISSANSNKVINNTCMDNHYSGVFIESSDSNLIYNNTIGINTFAGISCMAGGFNAIINNTCFNDANGVYIDTSSNSIIINNTLLSHSVGVWLAMFATSNTVSNNTSSGSSISIELDSNADNNDVLWNIFEAKYDNAFDDGTSNIFDYNYWSDYT